MLQIFGWCLVIASLLIGTGIILTTYMPSISLVFMFVFFILLASLTLSLMH